MCESKSNSTGGTEQDVQLLDAQTHRGEQGVVNGNSSPLLPVHHCASVRLVVAFPASYLLFSYNPIGFPSRYLSNQFMMCCSRSTRCTGLPARDNSCDSPGKRTCTVVLRRYLRARNIASPPWLGGARRSSSPRMNIRGVVTESA